MKTKPLLIAILCLAVIGLGIFFYVKYNKARKGNTNAIVQFIAKFNFDLQDGNIDTLNTFFADSHNLKVHDLLNVLTNKTGLGGKDSASFKTTFNYDKLEILSGNADAAVVRVPVTLSHDNFDSQTSSITFVVRKFRDGQYKFVKVKADGFAKDYLAYKDRIDERFAPPKPVEYSAITLAAFKTADSLKSKYDSVVWFQHLGNQNYFYVTKGSLDSRRMYDLETQLDKDSAKTYKMGLLGPDLREIVPVEYDLVHNINATFKGLIEVDKDDKHGFYSLDGKLVAPVEYEQILPVKDGAHLAALRKGDDYYWLNNDLSVSEKADIKVTDIISQIKDNLHFAMLPLRTDVMESNSHENHQSLYIPPSYLVDLNIMSRIEHFTNPLRKNTENEDYQTTDYNVDLDRNTADLDKPGVFETLFYSIKSHYIGGRGDLYVGKSLILVDKQHNRLLSHKIDIMGEEGDLPKTCGEYSIKMLPDSLIEVKVSASLWIGMPTDTIISETIHEGPAYHYFKILNNKLVERKTSRTFSFTQFVKMNDSYLRGCYDYLIENNQHPDDRKNLQADYLKPKFYQYIINEIYADYNYKFKNQKWIDAFQDYGGVEGYKPENTSVDDSLTAIDKYNINWLRQKMARPVIKSNPLAMK